MISAKVWCNSKTESGTGDQRAVNVKFTADYRDGRNQEWARWTPSLDLSVTLKGEVADRFAIGKGYTLTFEPEE